MRTTFPSKNSSTKILWVSIHYQRYVQLDTGLHNQYEVHMLSWHFVKNTNAKQQKQVWYNVQKNEMI